MAAKKKKKDPKARFDFVDKRAVFREDLTVAERRQTDKMRKQQQYAAPGIALTETKDEATKQALSDVKPKRESRNAVVKRLTKKLTEPDPELRLPGEAVVPDADWYPRVHAARLRGVSVDTGIDPRTVATASGVMSPLNSPDNERAAVRALADAHARNAGFRIDADVRGAVEASMPVDKKSGQRQSTGVSNLPSGTARFHDLSPEDVRDLTSKDVRESGVLSTDLDLEGIARAGTNKETGVRGIRGEGLNTISPPASAPKVNTYTQHGYNFGVPHDEDSASGYGTKSVPEETNDDPPKFGGAEDPFIAQEIRWRAGHAVDKASGEVHKDQATLDVWGLNDDHIEMTKGLHDYLTSRGASVRARHIGTSVRVRDLHPSAVQAMADPEVSDHHEEGERLQKLAKLSSNLPTVIDSHANGSIHGYGGLASKPTGSEKAGYWQHKTLGDGTPLLGVRDGRVTAAGLQHAEYDSILRDTAKNIVTETGMDMDYPSTAVQAGIWTADRREGQDDAKFNRVRRAEKKSADQEAKRDTSRSAQFNQLEMF